MTEEIIKDLIAQADLAITQKNYDKLLDFYSDDAILVVKPGLQVQGKQQIKQAFVKIGEYFNDAIKPTQGKIIILATSDTALVLSQTFIEAPLKTDSEYDMIRNATYIYRLIDGKWLCVIDNSYGVTLLDY